MSDEAGFTLIELLVSMVILVVGLFGLVASFDTFRGLADQSEHQAGAGAVAERQLDAGIGVPFGKLALTCLPGGTPACGTDDTAWTNVRDYGVQAAGATLSPILPTGASGGNDCTLSVATLPDATLNYSEASANDERKCLVACPSTSGTACTSAGLVAPYSDVTDARGNRYRVYRYVTWVNDVPCGVGCPNPGIPRAGAPAGETNPWKGDYKRLTIAVQVIRRGTALAPTARRGGPRNPIVVSAVKIDPTKGLANSPGGSSPVGLPGVIG